MTRSRFQRQARGSMQMLVASLLLLPALCLAETLNLEGKGEMEEGMRYTFIEGAWITQDVDDFNIDGEGYALRAVMALDRHWHIVGNYSRTNLGDAGIDTDLASAGVGYAYGVASSWDLIGRAGAARVKINREKIDGWMAQALARGQLGQRVELEGGVQHVKFNDDNGDDTSFLAATRFNITDWFSAGLSGSIGGDITEYGLTIRFATH